MPQTHTAIRGLLAAREEPLFQTLKELPETELKVTRLTAVQERDGSMHCRILIANEKGYAHLVHLQGAWKENEGQAYLTSLSDNDFELLPQESKEIEVAWRQPNRGQKAPPELIVSATNAASRFVQF